MRSIYYICPTRICGIYYSKGRNFSLRVRLINFSKGPRSGCWRHGQINISGLQLPKDIAFSLLFFATIWISWQHTHYYYIQVLYYHCSSGNQLVSALTDSTSHPHSCFAIMQGNSHWKWSHIYIKVLTQFSLIPLRYILAGCRSSEIQLRESLRGMYYPWRDVHGGTVL